MQRAQDNPARRVPIFFVMHRQCIRGGVCQPHLVSRSLPHLRLGVRICPAKKNDRAFQETSTRVFDVRVESNEEVWTRHSVRECSCCEKRELSHHGVGWLALRNCDQCRCVVSLIQSAGWSHCLKVPEWRPSSQRVVPCMHAVGSCS